MDSLQNRDSLQRLYLVGTKYLSILCLGIIPLLLPVADEILTVWMRRAADPVSVYIFQVLLFSTMLNASTGLGSSIGVGIGKPGILAYSNIVMAVVNIVGSTLFFFVFGLKGIVWGTASGLFVSTFLCFLLLNRAMNVSSQRFTVTVPLMPFIVNAGAAFVLVKLYGIGASMHPSFFSGGNSDYWIIAVNTVLLLAISAAVYAATKFITYDEIREFIPFSKQDST